MSCLETSRKFLLYAFGCQVQSNFLLRLSNLKNTNVSKRERERELELELERERERELEQLQSGVLYIRVRVVWTSGFARFDQ